MSELSQLLRYVRPHAPKLALSVGLMAIVGLCHGLVAVLIEPVFDRVLNPTAEHAPIRLLELPFTDRAILLDSLLPDSLGSVWSMIAVAIFGVFLVKGACDFAGNFLVNYAGLAGVRDLRNHVYSVVVNQSPAFFQSRHTGRLVSALVNDIERIQVALSHILADLLRQGFIVLALLWVLLQTDWKLAAISLTVLPAVLIPTARIGRRLRATTRTAQDDLADLTQILHETIAGNRVVKAFGMEGFEEERFRRTAQRLFRSSLRYVRQQAVSSPLIEVFGALTIVGLLSYVRGQVMVGQMTAGQFTTFVVALMMLYQPVKRLNGIYNIFQQALGSSQRVFEYLAHPHDVPEAAEATPLPPFSRSVEFRDVGFHYPGHPDEPTLRNFQLQVQAGEVVAIVGPSGAGKSTLLNLLPRFFDPTSGAILLDGRDLRSATLPSLRDQFSLVTQETFLFDDTVRNNIAYGRPDISDEAVRRAARAAIADEFISALPEGYETHLGERGHRLSGGQRQRIAIARALLKDAPILLLDEATSHLDSEAELLVQQALANLMEGRTVIVVAHRLSTIRSADKIVVLEGGRLVDVGQHERLLARCPLYQRLFELQSANP
ncbi:MAG: ATP-binding cassette domain-containing protein [Acidobacteria bacterium]|nr:ATP-binding cassette domain-containing protein [Acidobacteriota bacterium]